MTKEQLAKLDLSGGPLCCGIHEALVQRLLLERKRLLEALRPFTEGAGAMGYRKMMYEYGMEHEVKQTDAALAAVAFAEAPAD